jgi:SAM-dependent methyltransferase
MAPEARETAGGASAVGTMTLDDTRAAWDRVAAGYDRTHLPTHPLPEKGLRLAGLRPGMRFLDVAAGPGALSIPAARLGASVLATDISPGMLDMLRKRVRDESLSVETRVMDGHALDLENDAFDVVGSQFGVMLFPDMPKGIAEMVRVVKPGGHVLLIAFGDVRKVEFITFLARGIQAVRPDFAPPIDPPPLPFQLQDPERLRHEFTRVGLKDVRVEMTTESLEYGTGGELWDWLVSSNPIVEAILSDLDLATEERQQIEKAVEKLARERAAGGKRAVLTVPINIGIGTK